MRALWSLSSSVLAAPLVASDAQLASIVCARVDYEIAMASASNGFSREARLEHVHIPPRYAPYLRSPQVGHQICA